MKKVVIATTLAASILCSSCIGSFSAFNSLRDWNEDITANKFGNELIFIALWVIPVYQLASLGDLLIFNSIEFWGGDNPIAMKPSEEETQVVTVKKNTYQITATQNRFDVVVLEGKKKGKTATLIYLPEDQSWNKLNGDQSLTKLASLKDGFMMAHLPTKTVQIPDNLSKSAMASLITEGSNTYEVAELE